MASHPSSLSEEMTRKAKFLLNETPERRCKDVKAVLDQIETRPDINFTNREDGFVLRFLRARRFNQFEAFKLYANYFEFRQQNSDLFDQFTLDEPGLNRALMDGFPSVLPEPDQLNRRIILLFAYNWDTKQYGLTSIFRSLLLSLEKLIEDELVQVNGLVFIIDWTHFTFKQSTGIHPKILKLMIHALHECFPARFEEIHFINQPWYIDAIFHIMKPFLEDDAKQKIHLHGNNLALLYRHVQPDILPAELGGNQPPYHIQSWLTHMTGKSDTEARSNGPAAKPEPPCFNTRSQTFPTDASLLDLQSQSALSAVDDDSLILG